MTSTIRGWNFASPAPIGELSVSMPAALTLAPKAVTEAHAQTRELNAKIGEHTATITEAERGMHPAQQADLAAAARALREGKQATGTPAADKLRAAITAAEAARTVAVAARNDAERDFRRTLAEHAAEWVAALASADNEAVTAQRQALAEYERQRKIRRDLDAMTTLATDQNWHPGGDVTPAEITALLERLG
ncbi:MAG: hypothetical protein ACRDRL_33705 [Sciscionella sp.]